MIEPASDRTETRMASGPPPEAANPPGNAADPALAAFLAGRDATCPGCGYNLRGVTGGHCPECGRGLALHLDGGGRGRHRGLVAVLLVLLVLGGMNAWRAGSGIVRAASIGPAQTLGRVFTVYNAPNAGPPMVRLGTPAGAPTWSPTLADTPAPPLTAADQTRARLLGEISPLGDAIGQGLASTPVAPAPPGTTTLTATGNVTINVQPGLTAITNPGGGSMTYVVNPPGVPGATGLAWGSVAPILWVDGAWWTILLLAVIAALIVIVARRRRGLSPRAARLVTIIAWLGGTGFVAHEIVRFGQWAT